MEPTPAEPDLFKLLASAEPADRASAVLRLLEQGEGKPLDLASRDGARATLENVDLGRADLEVRIALLCGGAGEGGPVEAPAWWDAQARGLSLRAADLRGAKLGGAVLTYADLRKADLRDATLAGADLRGVRLEEADLRGADLAGALLRGAQLGNADLRGTMLEEADLRRAVMRFAKLEDAALDGADLRKADLWGADLTAATLVGADLRGAVLKEASLAGADFSRTLLRGADAGKADFSVVNLQAADLRRANLTGATFSGAVLRDANLRGLDLSTCDLAGVHLRGASLDGTKLRARQFGGAIGEEPAREFGEARKGYLALERYFIDAGDPDAAAWAYRRRRRMQKHELLESARAAHAAGNTRDAATGYFHYASDQLVEWVCDYGESIPRILLSMLVVYLAFTVLYGLTGAVVRAPAVPGRAREAVRDPVDLAIFSLMAITSGNTPGGMEPRGPLTILVAGFEALLGVALTGLLGFVTGNLVRR